MKFYHKIVIASLLSSQSEAFAPSTAVPAASRFQTTATTATTVLASTAATASTIAATATSSPSIPSILQDFEHHTSPRLPYSPTGYSKWTWKTHHNAVNQQLSSDGNNDDQKQQQNQQTQQQQHYVEHSINYLEMGDPTKPALLLIHGFGASSYHFRHNIPILARKYHVYAIDMLGFGWSDKPIMDYDATVWKDQVVDFVQEIIWKNDDNTDTTSSTKKKPITVAGNSLGGYTAMYSASDHRIKDHVNGCILLNAAGKFRNPETDAQEANAPPPNPIITSISSAIQRLVIAASFVYTKQPSRIEQVLKNVYPVNAQNVDRELVESIQVPSLDANAAEVFYRVITKNGSGPQAYVDDILKELECPVLLAWGEEDPWIKSAAADKIEILYEEFHGVGSGGVGAEDVNTKKKKWCRRVSIGGGHCPHDEAPEEVNVAIMEFVDEILGIEN